MWQIVTRQIVAVPITLSKTLGLKSANSCKITTLKLNFNHFIKL